MQKANKMTTFSEKDKLKALAIVNIFETGRPMGDYAACVVLNDGAGVSYGFQQFTHRSGSLKGVVERYLANGGQIGREILTAAVPLLRSSRAAAINEVAGNSRFKNALRAASVTREMKEAQHFVATERYLKPAILICERLRFTLPLSLAVVYDSVVHGSWERVATRVKVAHFGAITPKGVSPAEKAWITEYVRRRHAWLAAIVRLRPTTYRTKFFLDQIAVGNWELRTPMIVHGVRLSEPSATAGGETPQTATLEPTGQPPVIAGGSDMLAHAAANFDRIDSVVSGLAARTDRAKSLWATVGGTLWQAAWAVFGFVAGLPREVWIVVAIFAGLLTIGFLYRQIILGQIREALFADART
ncbi:MAG: chitosanase [Pyrinomonadaceae bacterium]